MDVVDVHAIANEALTLPRPCDVRARSADPRSPAIPSVGVFWSARSARFAYFRVGADQAVMARRLDAAPAVEPLTGLPPDTQHVSKRN